MEIILWFFWIIVVGLLLMLSGSDSRYGDKDTISVLLYISVSLSLMILLASEMEIKAIVAIYPKF